MEQSFHYLLMLNYTTFQKNLLEQVRVYGLTSGQPRILDYLSAFDGASQKEIAHGCNMEAGSLTSVLNRMEEKGMIERKILNGNRRTFHVFLTPFGKELQKKVVDAFAELERESMEDFSEEEKQCFLQMFQRIQKNIKGKKE